jgi:hypothetical protein
VKVIRQPFPRLDLLDAKARFSICQRCEEQEAPKRDGKNDTGSDPAAEQALCSDTFTNRAGLGTAVALNSGVRWWGLWVYGLNIENELDKSACNEHRSEMCGQVVVQEELTAHDVEGDVMSSPGKEEEAGRVVKTGTGACEMLDRATR